MTHFNCPADNREYQPRCHSVLTLEATDTRLGKPSDSWLAAAIIDVTNFVVLPLQKGMACLQSRWSTVYSSSSVIQYEHKRMHNVRG